MPIKKICKGTTQQGKPCKRPVTGTHKFCTSHTRRVLVVKKTSPKKRIQKGGSVEGEIKELHKDLFTKLEKDTSYDTDEKQNSTFNIPEKFIDADPSNSNKYLKWIVESYILGGIKKYEDLGRVQTALEKYVKLSNGKKLKTEHKDILAFCGIAGCTKKANLKKGLEDVLEEYTSLEVAKKKDENKPDKSEYEEWYNDDDFRIIIPKTEKASCYYGQGTRWCTAASKNNMFSTYSKEGNLYIITDKKDNKKYQFHQETGSFMDEKDEEVGFGSIQLLDKLNTIFKHELVIRDYFNDILRKIKHKQKVDIKVCMSQNDIVAILALILSYDDKLFTYYLNYLSSGTYVISKYEDTKFVFFVSYEIFGDKTYKQFILDKLINILDNRDKDNFDAILKKLVIVSKYDSELYDMESLDMNENAYNHFSEKNKKLLQYIFTI